MEGEVFRGVDYEGSDREEVKAFDEADREEDARRVAGGEEVLEGGLLAQFEGARNGLIERVANLLGWVGTRTGAA